MKKLLAIFLCITIAISMCSCSDNSHVENVPESPFRFTLVGWIPSELYAYGKVSILREQQTDVLYLYMTGDYNGITAFLKSDGTPMTYDEYKEIIYDY